MGRYGGPNWPSKMDKGQKNRGPEGESLNPLRWECGARAGHKRERPEVQRERERERASLLLWFSFLFIEVPVR